VTIYIHYGSDHFDPELFVPARNAGSTDFGFRPSERVTEQEKIQIRWMLSRINGSEVVKNMNPDELAEWVFEVICWAVAIGERHDCKYNGEYLTFPFMTKDELGRDVIQRQMIEKWLKEKADDSFKG